MSGWKNKSSAWNETLDVREAERDTAPLLFMLSTTGWQGCQPGLIRSVPNDGA